MPENCTPSGQDAALEASIELPPGYLDIVRIVRVAGWSFRIDCHRVHRWQWLVSCSGLSDRDEPISFHLHVNSEDRERVDGFQSLLADLAYGWISDAEESIRGDMKTLAGLSQDLVIGSLRNIALSLRDCRTGAIVECPHEELDVALREIEETVTTLAATIEDVDVDIKRDAILCGQLLRIVARLIDPPGSQSVIDLARDLESGESEAIEALSRVRKAVQ